MDIRLDCVLMIVERLRQESYRLVAERLEEFDLVESEGRHDGVGALASPLVGAKPECLVLDDRTACAAAELLPVEWRVDGVAGLEQARVGFPKYFRRVG